MRCVSLQNFGDFFFFAFRISVDGLRINEDALCRNPKLMRAHSPPTLADMYRLSHEGPGDISFIARGTISYFITSECSERGAKYNIVTRAIKLILPSLECDNLFITYLCLYQSYSGAKIKLFSN